MHPGTTVHRDGLAQGKATSQGYKHESKCSCGTNEYHVRAGPSDAYQYSTKHVLIQYSTKQFCSFLVARCRRQMHPGTTVHRDGLAPGMLRCKFGASSVQISSSSHPDADRRKVCVRGMRGDVASGVLTEGCGGAAAPARIDPAYSQRFLSCAFCCRVRSHLYMLVALPRRLFPSRHIFIHFYIFKFVHGTVHCGPPFHSPFCIFFRAGLPSVPRSAIYTSVAIRAHVMHVYTRVICVLRYRFIYIVDLSVTSSFWTAVERYGDHQRQQMDRCGTNDREIERGIER